MAASTSKSRRAPGNRAARASKQEAKAAKAAAKAARRAESKGRMGQIWQAFKMQRRQDKRLIPYLLLTLAATVGIVMGFGYLTGMWWWLSLIFGVVMGVMVALIVFARRVQRSVYEQAEGNPGAAAWSLQNNLKGRWRITPAVAGTSHLDAVHRVIGRPGIVLVGEGVPHRVGPLIAQEKKRIARVVGDIPIYDVIIGGDEGQVRLRKLNSFLLRLPRNISVGEVGALDTKLAALANRAPQAGMPKGPLPQGVKMRNMQRAMRRR